MNKKENFKLLLIALVLFLLLVFYIFHNQYRKVYFEKFLNAEVDTVFIEDNNVSFNIEEKELKDQIVAVLRNKKSFKSKSKGISDIMFEVYLSIENKGYCVQIFKDIGSNEFYVLAMGKGFSYLAYDENNLLDEFYNDYIKENHKEKKENSGSAIPE